VVGVNLADTEKYDVPKCRNVARAIEPRERTGRSATRQCSRV